MQSIFLWFYRLPMAAAVFLVLLTTALFLLLRSKYGKRPYWKAGATFLLICWIGMIFFATLGSRTENVGASAPVLIPFLSYYSILNGGQPELYRSNFMNAVLFYPAGLLCCELLPAHWTRARKLVLAAGFLVPLSIGIEYIQYRLCLGLAEADDVIHNTLGALLGALACSVQLRPIRHK